MKQVCKFFKFMDGSGSATCSMLYSLLFYYRWLRRLLDWPALCGAGAVLRALRGRVHNGVAAHGARDSLHHNHQLPATAYTSGKGKRACRKSKQNNRERKSGKQWAAKNRFWQWPNDSQKNTSSPENCSAFLTPRGSKNVIRQVPDCSMLTMTLQHPRIIVCAARNLCNFVKDFYYNAPL